MGKLTVVSGVPRSGTSLQMLCMRAVFGEESILGYDLLKRGNEVELIQQPDESLEQFEYRKFEYYNNINPEDKEKELKRKKMNPGGFWEHPVFSVRGLSYSYFNSEIVKKIKQSTIPLIGKIVSQGLMNTTPELIDKIIYMVRDPRCVAKSQEDLERRGKFKKDGKIIDIYEGQKINSPNMYITSSIIAAKWFIDNPSVPVLFVNYDDLIDEPEHTLNKVGEFLEKDFSSAYSCVSKGLRRSKAEKTGHPLEEDAELIYTLFKQKKFAEIISTFEDEKRAVNRLGRKWKCGRTNTLMGEAHCMECKKKGDFMQSLKKFAEDNKIPWDKKPCAFECRYDLDRKKYLTIKESIEKNHWA